MYNPAKGELILDETLNEDSESLIAYWIDEVLYEPMINDPELEAAWTSFLTKYEKETDGDLPYCDDVEKFLTEYDNPNWIVYAITSTGIACGPVSNTTWHVVDKDTVVEEL